MLKQRVFTALLLVPCVLLGIHFAPTSVLTVAIALIVLLTSLEWVLLIPINQLLNRVSFIGVMGIGLIGALSYPELWLGSLFLWLYLLLIIVAYPKSDKWWAYRPIIGGFAVVLLPAFFIASVKILQRQDGDLYFIYLLFLIWAADSGAYAAGKLWGAHKLIPLVSPGKTAEGLLGGLCASGLIMLIGYWYFKPLNSLEWFGLSTLTVLLSVFGDLFISMLKRHSGVKDTGHLLPGHGGLLDRLDSLIAASPLFYIGLSQMQFS